MNNTKIKLSLPLSIKKDNKGKKYHLIIKEEDGNKKKFIYGIASGPEEDSSGEKITPETINSFQKQAENKNILLYADKHDVESLTDIGILTKSKITNDGEWWTEFRLYDDSDNVDSRSKELALKLWNQLNGYPPYNHPIEKGFSIEGYGMKSIINGKPILSDIDLDGVVIVPEPAYKNSFVQAINKAMVFKEINKLTSYEFFIKSWKLQELFQKTLEDQMKRNGERKEEYIRKAGIKYINELTKLSIENPHIFKEDEKQLKNKIVSIHKNYNKKKEKKIEIQKKKNVLLRINSIAKDIDSLAEKISKN